ncbi:LLM class flavin-dependent oxidoreductase [Photorhabdus tasmaniensis]|nr:LLM class flavin-dependent oxidoreductase [Photorhabdus tasmaniensis]
MMAKKEFGVFLPIAKGGWIISKNTPPLDASYQQNREAAILADQIGLDFIMSMSKWRGFGGETEHWGCSLESVTMMAGIAEVTHHAKLIATMHAGLHNPAVTAKMIATLDQISHGRAGLNIVSGSFKDEFEQMGEWNSDLDHDQRYAMTEEWTQLIKRLWCEKQVDHQGEFFNLKNCVSEPKPVSVPRPYLVCAGQSERGLRFSVRNTDVCFIGGKDEEETQQISLTAKRIAAEYGTTTKTFCMCTIICAETDEEAETLAQFYRDGLDIDAVKSMMHSFGVDVGEKSNAMVERSQNAFMTHTAIGNPETCLRQLSDLLRECELDGVMLIFPDYVEGLTTFGTQILPQLRTEFA